MGITLRLLFVFGGPNSRIVLRYFEGRAKQIDPFPTQCEDLTDPHAGQNGDGYHRRARFSQPAEQSASFPVRGVHGIAEILTVLGVLSLLGMQTNSS